MLQTELVQLSGRFNTREEDFLLMGLLQHHPADFPTGLQPRLLARQKTENIRNNPHPPLGLFLEGTNPQYRRCPLKEQLSVNVGAATAWSKGSFRMWLKALIVVEWRHWVKLTLYVPHVRIYTLPVQSLDTSPINPLGKRVHTFNRYSIYVHIYLIRN